MENNLNLFSTAKNKNSKRQLKINDSLPYVCINKEKSQQILLQHFSISPSQ